MPHKDNTAFTDNNADNSDNTNNHNTTPQQQQQNWSYKKTETYNNDNREQANTMMKQQHSQHQTTTMTAKFVNITTYDICEWTCWRFAIELVCCYCIFKFIVFHEID